MTYDVIAVEDGLVTSITVWKDCELQRALRLAKRENGEINPRIYGIIERSSCFIGCKVNQVTKEFINPKNIMIDGRKIKQADEVLVVTIYKIQT